MKFRKPMLAKSIDGRIHLVEYPCFIQPKIDGIRCITDGRQFWSRNGKLFPQQNLRHLQIPPSKYLIDGELSLTGGHADFEEIVSIVKRGDHEHMTDIRFNAFDMMIPAAPYSVRKEQLKEFFQQKQVKIQSEHWNRLVTKKAVSIQYLREYHQQFLDHGYEGSMVRHASGLYVSKRTIDLLKWKTLHDHEFKIVRVKEAKGKDAGTPVFICMSKGGEFAARPMGSMKQRRQMWKDRDNLIGKKLTVEYQNLTRYGKPRFPRAKVLRDYE